MDEGQQRLIAYTAEGTRLRDEFFTAAAPLVVEAARTLSLALAGGRRIYVLAEPESQAQAESWAEIFIHGHLIDRPPLPMLALRPATRQGFCPQIQTLGRPGDVLTIVAAETISPAMAESVTLAREQKMFTLALAGNIIHTNCHLALCVPHASLPLVRETHLALMHAICELVDYYLFENVTALGLGRG